MDREDKLTHLDERGNARMVDVSGKDETARRAVAEAFVKMKPETVEAVREGSLPKGDVAAAARIAGIMAAKKTGELIPMCHPLNLHHASVSVDIEEGGVRITADVRLAGKTGVEMEALTAASVAALTVYDMCKSVEKGMTITDVRLLQKEGGKSGDWRREGE